MPSATYSDEHDALVNALLESSFDAVLIFEEGQVVDANSKAAKVLGFDSPETLRGSRPEELATLSSRDAFQKVLSINPSGSVNLELQRRGGSAFDASVQCRRASKADRGLQVVTVHASGTVERSSPEVKAAHLEALLKTMPDAVVTTDRSGLIREWNESAQRIFGYERAEVYGRPLEIIMPERYEEGHREGMRRVEAGGEKRAIGRTVQMEGLRKNGEEFPLELSLLQWNADGTIYYTGIMRDLSERRKDLAASGE